MNDITESPYGNKNEAGKTISNERKLAGKRLLIASMLTMFIAVFQPDFSGFLSIFSFEIKKNQVLIPWVIGVILIWLGIRFFLLMNQESVYHAANLTDDGFEKDTRQKMIEMIKEIAEKDGVQDDYEGLLKKRDPTIKQHTKHLVKLKNKIQKYINTIDKATPLILAVITLFCLPFYSDSFKSKKEAVSEIEYKVESATPEVKDIKLEQIIP